MCDRTGLHASTHEESITNHVNARLSKLRRYLLLDDRVVDDTRNAEITLGDIEKHRGNPLYGEDKPWEMRFDNLYANVIFDDEDRLYKVWYSPFIVDHSAKAMSAEQWRETKYQAPSNREMGLCYATSRDGFTWNKPALGLVDYDGSKDNNILWRGGGNTRSKQAGPHGAGVFKDTRDSDPARRYKTLLKSESLSVALSNDGIQWDLPITCPDVNSAGDTHNNAFWAPTLDKYVGITRRWSESFERQVARTSSDDFLSWDRTQVVLQGLDKRHQTYAMPVFFHAGVYIGFLAIHDQESDRVWAELAWSPDTETWHRVLPGTPFIPNGDNEGDYDWGCVFPAACPVFEKDEIRLYYGGNDGLHTSWRNGYFCLATLRPDGFAGYKASDENEPATVTTAPIYDGKQQLGVSADIPDGGELVAHVLNHEGRLVAESQPLTATVSDVAIRWLDESAFEPHATGQSRLQFVLRGAILYSFSLSDLDDG